MAAILSLIIKEKGVDLNGALNVVAKYDEEVLSKLVPSAASRAALSHRVPIWVSRALPVALDIERRASESIRDMFFLEL